jgi:16S rRNA processing protein RimM
LSSDWIPVGRVGRPHGVHGAFVVEHASDSADRFAVGAQVYVAREPARVVESKRAGGRLVVTLDRETLRGAALEIPRSELPEPAADSFYVFQLVGLTVEDEGGRPIGRVQEVDPGVANDVLRLDTGVDLPLVEECVREVDLDAKRIVIAPGFAEPG